MAEQTAEQKQIAELKAEIAKRDKAEADRQQAAAVAAQEAADRQPDETIPGGKYLIGEVYVDCDGKPLKDQG